MNSSEDGDNVEGFHGFIEFIHRLLMHRTRNSPAGKSDSFFRSECSDMLARVTEYITFVYELQPEP